MLKYAESQNTAVAVAAAITTTESKPYLLENYNTRTATQIIFAHFVYVKRNEQYHIHTYIHTSIQISFNQFTMRRLK